MLRYSPAILEYSTALLAPELGMVPVHSDVTRPGGWPIFEKWYISEHQFQLFIRF